MGKPTVVRNQDICSWRDAADAIVADTRARYNQADNSYPGNATSHSGDRTHRTAFDWRQTGFIPRTASILRD